MMKFPAVIVLVTSLTGSVASAAIMTVTPAGLSPNGVYSLFLNGESTTFNGVGLSVKPNNGVTFLDVVTQGVPGVPRPPGDPITYRNRLLDADPGEVPGGRMWNLLGVITTSTEIAFNGGPIGQTISTAGEQDGRLFLANFKLAPGATATARLQLVNGIDTVYEQTLTFPIPEPSTVGLTGLALAASVNRLRRRRSALHADHR